MASYIAQLRLELELYDLANQVHCLREFEKMWPREKAIEWSSILITASDDHDFQKKLDLEFRNHLKTISPYPSKSNWSIASTITANGWRKLGNGMHDFGYEITYAEATAPNTNYKWRIFDPAGPQPNPPIWATVRVAGHWCKPSKSIS